MCNQTVCLIAAELERQGISTVVIQLLRAIAERLCPPRALCVPFPHGFPLSAPADAAKQRAVIGAALRLVERQETRPPVLVDYVDLKR